MLALASLLAFIYLITLLVLSRSNSESFNLDSVYKFAKDHNRNEISSNNSYLIVENFNLQSDFRPYHIYPYKRISRDLFNVWIDEQVDISFNKMLENIGDLNWSPDLVMNESVSLGAVIASPSQRDPDYFYQWIRDGAIAINSIVNYLNEDGFQNKSLQTTVENYLQNSYHLQRINNPSGEFDIKDLKNLGEPKFMVDSTAFWDDWGRPQNDGPALRIIAIDNFMKSLEEKGKDLLDKDFKFKNLSDIYFKLVKLDLQYICLYWHVDSFDLWEEINALHFFTSLAQLKAIKIGMKLQEKYDYDDLDFGNLLKSTFDGIYNFMIDEESGFIKSSLNHIVETPSIMDRRSGLDSATLIGSLLTHEDEDDVIPFDVTDGYILNTLSELVKGMKYLYPVNHNRIGLNLGVGLGRYPEDVYNGNGISEGNPWFLTTLSAGELLFKLVSNLYDSGEDLIIDSKNKEFYFNNIIEVNHLLEFSSMKSSRDLVLKIPYNSLAFNQTVYNIFQYGESFMDVVREHVSNDGEMSEQFNKYSGYLEGAEDLSWSYGAFWSAYRWRSDALKFIE